jgi:C_GCAxxG_C_C family probable redox protein
MKNDIKEKALESFRAGMNCAQAVFTSYSSEIGYDRDVAAAVATGFGGGIGRLQGTCGAMTGSVMVISMDTARKHEANMQRKEVSYSKIQKFEEEFRKIHGSTDCRTLLNCEIRTEEGHRIAKEQNLFGTICEKCIANSIEIVDKLINE